ncbi:hypothetical protein [Rhodococcus sp. B7740]|uniref:hypothetical protein n=1 Tax=Rhodococcus sp. B7740 TaxID=1564114 RepID=UPI0005EB0DEE|nr:hypothetical protein [Rhodococcus sp. B7740]
MSQVIVGGTIVLWAAPRWRRALYRIGLKRHHRWLGDVGGSARITAHGNEILELACEWSDYRKEYGTRNLHREHEAFKAGWEAARGKSFEPGPLR